MARSRGSCDRKSPPQRPQAPGAGQRAPCSGADECRRQIREVAGRTQARARFS
ncbi:hypothetical protein FM103_04470 [Corynebacterium xerosis]|nr:hypothetical protein FM103_04470 [Corynebacterium xerosis]